MVNLRHDADPGGEESGLSRTSIGNSSPTRTLDDEGVPSSHPVSDWLDLFSPDDPIEPMASRWLQAVLRFGRADGSPVFGPPGRSSTRLRALEAWSKRLADPSLAAVVARWLPSKVIPQSPPPLPSDSRRDRTLAVLRPDWSPRGDLVAVDHRRAGDETLVEMSARGRTWLGPSWTSGDSSRKSTPSRPTHWTSGPYVDGFEWTYKSGRKRVSRCAVLLRGRSMALLGQQDDGQAESAEIRLDLGVGIEASLVEGSRAIQLTSGKGQPTARLIPLGLPCHDRTTELGSIAIEGRQVVVRQTGEARSRWLPLLVCWGKAPTAWRPVTVAYRSKACRGDEAVAARVAWGPRDEGLVVYRSLARPALRSFLGHQTAARFLVGSFTRSGDVRPILKVES